jgi:uncharacterized protein YdhG (YjbR/CyaY superfamily)
MIEGYLKKVPPSQRTELERIRKIVQRLVPDAEEVISYGMPTFKYKGKNLIHFAAFKNHLSIFPTAEPIKTLHEEFKPFIASKGTLKFTEDKPIPERLIKALVKQRLEAIGKS